MDRKQVVRAFTAAVFVGLLVFVATRDLGYGVVAFVIALLGWGGWEVLTKRRG